MSLEILHWLLSRGSAGEFKNFGSLDEWSKEVSGLISSRAGPFEEAVIGGFTGDRMAHAFVAGYQGALKRLFKKFRNFDFASFCITEEEGGHPNAIETRIREDAGGYRVEGHKKFISMPGYADLLFVAVNAGTGHGGRKRIKIAAIDPGLEGVRIERMPRLPFVPEIDHAGVFFKDVMIATDSLLPGDGYAAFIKPFRTIEDIHLFAAITAYLFRIAGEYRWDLAFREELLGIISSLKAITSEDPLSPHTHITLAGLLRWFHRFLEDTVSQWDRVNDGVRALWERDRKLLDVAGRIREKRLARAWENYQ
jgi:hypothetical protein